VGGPETKSIWWRPGARPAATAALLVAAGLAWPALAEAVPLALPPVRIGVIASRPKPQVLAGWQPLAAALHRALPDQRFEVEALDYPELEAAIAAQRIDLVITNPAHYVAIRTRQPMSGVLATVIEQGPGVPLPAFGGAMVVRADRTDLRGLADLAGARVAAVGLASLGGYQAQLHELVKAGVRPPGPDRLQLTGMPHDEVVELVLSRQADVGFVRAGTLEDMAKEGRLDSALLRVLNQQDLPGFPYAISTRLFPDWPVVSLSHVDPDLARRIAAALLMMAHGGLPPSAEAAFHGFAIPADYSGVEAMLRELRLAPFDAAPAFEAADVLRRYSAPLSVAAVGALVVALLLAILIVGNRRLSLARREAAEAASTLETVLATTTVGVARVSDRRLLWTSRHMEELFGYDAAELAAIGTRVLYPDDASYQRVGREYRAAFSEGRGYVSEQRMLRKDGSGFWARLRGSALPGGTDSIWTLEDVTDRRTVEEELRHALASNEATLLQLREEAAKVKQLSGLLPICMYCHKIRTDQGYWDGLEGYISAHSEALFSHGICPTCLDQKYPGS
jgi:PAS domain S-box-containing protein